MTRPTPRFPISSAAQAPGPRRPHRSELSVLRALVLCALLVLPTVSALGQCDSEVDVEVFDAPAMREGDTGRRDATFQVRLSHPGGSISPSVPPCPVDLTFGTPRGLGSATAGADYTPQGGTLTLTAEQPEAVVRVPVLGDVVDEPDEDFFLRIRLASDFAGPRILRDLARGVILDDDQAAADEIEVVGEAARSAVVGEVVPLAVRVLRGGEPVAGSLVEWRLVEGDGAFEPAGQGPRLATSVSDGAGVARHQVRTAGRPGVARVAASLLGGSGSVVMTITTEGDLGDLFPERPSGAASVADALDQICGGVDLPLGGLCDYLFGLPDGEQRAAVLAATPRQAPAAASLVVHAGHNQLDGLRDRLRSRRAEATSEGGGAAAGQQSGQQSGMLSGMGTDSGRFDLRLAGFGRAEAEAGAGTQAGPVPGYPGLAALRVPLGPSTARSTARYADEEAYLAERVQVAVKSAEARVQGGDGAAVAAAAGAGEEPGYDLDPPSRLGFFASGRYSSGERPSTFDEAGFDADVLGLTTGLDFLARPRALVGLAASYVDTDAGFYDGLGDLVGESYSLSAYGTVFRDHAYLELVVTGGRNDFTQDRGIVLPQPFAGADRYVARGELEGDQWGVTLTAGADRSFGALSVEGFARGSWVEASFDAYQESGAGPFDLAVSEQDVESLLAEAGVQLTYAASFSWGVLQPHLRASWLHESEGDVRLIRGRFVEDVQSLEVVLPVAAWDRDFANAGAGVTATFAGGRSLYAFYDRDLARAGLEMETLSVGLRLEL